MDKQELLNKIELSEKRCNAFVSEDKKKGSLADYADLAENGLWADAIEKALSENEVLVIPAREEPYLIEHSVKIPSDRRIEAYGAVLKIADGNRELMFRNANTADGTHTPIKVEKSDENIAILGGRYEEPYRGRGGYGTSGMYDNERSYYGVSTCLYFCNVRGLVLRDLEFAHCAGFAVQTGNITDAVMENISFDSCYADGLHINGGCHNFTIRDIKGSVGDDLVALNAYDWPMSSANFGPIENVLCENLELNKECKYPALRIQPGMYEFNDGSRVDCAVKNVILSDIRGITTYKMYYQTPPYKIGEEPRADNAGTLKNIWFSDINVDLYAPIDALGPYVESDPECGHFGAFEICSNADNINFENINLITHKDKYPLSHLIYIGRKSVKTDDGWEIFDPYLEYSVGEINLKNISIDGIPADDNQVIYYSKL